MDEQALINTAQKGDVAAFNQLVRAHQTLVYRTAYRVLGDLPAAEDATQDAFISAFKHIRSYHGGSFKAWLLRIVTNACYDQLRVKKRRPSTSLDAMSEAADDPFVAAQNYPSDSPQEYAERQELGQVIQRGINQLPGDQRAALVLADVDGLSYDEIAAA